MSNYFPSKQFLKYILVGFLGTGLDFLLLYSLVEYLHLFYLIAAVGSIAIVLWISFTCNKYWTFRDGRKKYLGQFLKYVLTHALGNGINLIILVFLVEVFGLWYILAKIFATAVSAIFNFFITKKWVFSQKTEEIEKIKI